MFLYFFFLFLRLCARQSFEVAGCLCELGGECEVSTLIEFGRASLKTPVSLECAVCV